MERRIFTPRILSTNIKTRRLGYIIAILRILEKSFLVIDSLAERLENWAESNKDFCQPANDAGWIRRTPKHYPPLRYIQLAKDLGLIKIANRECGVTKLGQPILYLTSSKDNPFDLTCEQICYLFKRILVTDYDFLMPLLKLLSSPQATPQIFDNLKKEILKHLRQREKKFVDIVKSSKFRNRIGLIEKWEKEREYLEHMIYPRLDWLVDMNMVNLERTKQNRYEITRGCMSFLNNFNSLCLEEELARWFDNKYYEAFFDAFRKPVFERKCRFDALAENQQSEQLGLLLEECFTRFSSIGLPFQHLSARTFLEYSCVKLMSEGIVTTFEMLIESLRRMTNYKFRWEYMLDDGYITRV